MPYHHYTIPQFLAYRSSHVPQRLSFVVEVSSEEHLTSRARCTFGVPSLDVTQIRGHFYRIASVFASCLSPNALGLASTCGVKANESCYIYFIALRCIRNARHIRNCNASHNQVGYGKRKLGRPRGSACTQCLVPGVGCRAPSFQQPARVIPRLGLHVLHRIVSGLLSCSSEALPAD